MGKIYCPLFLNPFIPNYEKRGEHTKAQYLRSMFKLSAVVPHVESCVLLERVSNRKAGAKIRIDVDLEDYYRIKDNKSGKA